MNVTQDPNAPVAPSVLAQAIVDLAAAAKRLSTSKLNQKAVVILLNHSTGVPQRDIKYVLAGIEQLQKDYLK